MLATERRLRILMVDDDDVSATILRDHLSDAGHELLVASNAE